MIKIFIPIIIFLTLSISIAFVQRPNDEEAQWASIAKSLIENKKLSTNIWPTENPLYKGWDKQFYSLPPASFIALSIWFNVFPITIFSIRMFSIFVGLIGLISWFFFYKKVSPDTAFFSILMLSCDFIYTRFTSVRPFDISIVTLLGLSFAIYLYLKDFDEDLAIVLSGIAGAFAYVVHPNGLIVPIETIFLIIYMNGIRFKKLSIYLYPHLIVVMILIFWVSQNYELFKLQFLGNYHQSSMRGIFTDIYQLATRTFGIAYGFGYGYPAMGKFLISILAIYLASMFKNKLIMYLLAIHFIFFIYISPHKWPIYSIYFIPFFVIGASSLNKKLSKLFIFIIFTSSLVCASYRIKRNDYEKYTNSVNELKKIINPNSKIYGSADLAFVFGFENVKHDTTIGMNGDLRDYIVIDKNFNAYFDYYKLYETDKWKSIEKILVKNYEKKHQNDEFELYELKQ